jgi:hypothetical protein
MSQQDAESILRSYARGVLVAITPLLSISETDPGAYIVAVVAGVIAPALRALDERETLHSASSQMW